MSFRESAFYNRAVLPYHFARAVVARARFGRFKKLRLIGVTGTNGKTTTCFMIWQMLNSAGYKTGLMTTVAWGGVGGGISAKTAKTTDKLDAIPLHNQIEHMTTVDVWELNRRLQAFERAGAEFAVLEITSHALAQFRTLGLEFEIAVLTNVTHDHLDYHRTFDRYVAAKTKLFHHAEFGVINYDDPSRVEFEQAITSRLGAGIVLSKNYSGKYTLYGIKSAKNTLADLIATEIKLKNDSIKYACDDIKFVDGELLKTGAKLSISVNLPGVFNVYNSLAAVAVGQKLGLSGATIARGLKNLKFVEGRMQRIDAGQDFTCIVDFAHTPDAFLKVFTSITAPDVADNWRDDLSTADILPQRDLRLSARQRIISLFGGAGRRDETTRAERGKIAGKFSDIVIITEDDSRDEDPAIIAAQFVDGARRAGLKDSQIIVELDRQTAIETAVRLANPGDIVLILGKGHEKTILRADGPHPFEDLKITKQALLKLRKERHEK